MAKTISATLLPNKNIENFLQDVTISEALDLVCSLTLHILTTAAEKYPDALSDIYDAYNYKAGAILAALDPGRELNPDFQILDEIEKENAELLSKVRE